MSKEAKTVVAGSEVIATTTEEKLFPSLPARLQLTASVNKQIFFPMLGKSAKVLAQCSKKHYTFFQPQLNLLNLLEHVARGRQEEAEALLMAEAKQIASKDQTDSKSVSSRLLLQESKIPITDYAGECFVNRMAFQIAIELLDRHMYRMLLNYLPLEKAREQFEGLIKVGAIKKLNYDLCLMTDEIAVQVAQAEGHLYLRERDGLLYLKTDEINIPGPLEEGMLYVREKEGRLFYSCVTLYGGIVVDVEIPKNTLIDEKEDQKLKATPLCFDKNKPQYKLLQSKILQFAEERFHTAKTVGTLMTRGRRKFERLKYHQKNYRDYFYNRIRDENIAYFCLGVGGAQRKLPAHGIYEYFYPNRAFDPLPLFNEQKLPRNTSYHEGVSVYPLRVYKRILIVKELDAKMVIDPQTIVMQKNAGRLTAHWINNNNKKFKSLDEREVTTLSSLLPLNKELRDPHVIAQVLFKFGCDSGVGFEFAIVRGRQLYGGLAITDGLPFVERCDLAAVTALCEERSQNDLNDLINILYSAPSLTTTTIAVPNTSLPKPAVTILKLEPSLLDRCMIS